jgi:hypothetical protein
MVAPRNCSFRPGPTSWAGHDLRGESAIVPNVLAPQEPPIWQEKQEEGARKNGQPKPHTSKLRNEPSPIFEHLPPLLIFNPLS